MKPGYGLFGLLLGFQVALCGAVEDWVEATPQPTAVQEWLEELSEHPLDLNTVAFDQLLQLPFFDKLSAGRLIDARSSGGGFERIDDVLGVAGWSPQQREVLVRFTLVRSIRPDRARMRAAAQVDERVRRSTWRADLQSSSNVRGYVSVRQDRSRPRVYDDVTVGVMYSPHGQHYTLAAGDYQFEAGTGLVFGTAYGGSDWLARSSDLKPGSETRLRSRPTTDRLSLYRGIGLAIQQGRINAALLLGDQRLDAAQGIRGAERITEGETSSTLLEDAQNAQLEERLAGAEVSVEKGGLSAGLCGYQSSFSPSLQPVPSAEQPFQLGGSRLQVGSVNLSATFSGLTSITEVAHSSPGGWAEQSAFAVGREHFGFAAYLSYATADFFSPHSKAWLGYGDDRANTDRVGIRIRVMGAHSEFGLHAWSSRSPFRTSSVPLRKSAEGVEFRSELALSETVDANLAAGRTWNEQFLANQPDVPSTFWSRIELALHQVVEYKVRLQIRSIVSEADRDGKLGTLLYVQTRYPNAIATVFLRIAFYNVESRDAALYVYENAPLGASPLAAFYHDGRRVTAMLTRSFGRVAAAVKLAQVSEDDAGVTTDGFEGAAQLGLSW
jgi:hypothetical protein